MNVNTALAEIPADAILKTAKTIKKIAYGIAGVGTLASYGTQVTLLLNNDFGMFSYAIPATIDALALGAAMALQIPRLDSVSRKIAGAILGVAVIVSVVANVWDATTGIQAAGHAWPVIAYLLGELLANRVRAFAERLQASQATPVTNPEVDALKAQIATLQAAAAAAVVAPVQVAAPLPRATRTAPHAVTRKATSHANCTHAATPKDRAACRAGR